MTVNWNNTKSESLTLDNLLCNNDTIVIVVLVITTNDFSFFEIFQVSVCNMADWLVQDKSPSLMAKRSQVKLKASWTQIVKGAG